MDIRIEVSGLEEEIGSSVTHAVCERKTKTNLDFKKVT